MCLADNCGYAKERLGASSYSSFIHPILPSNAESKQSSHQVVGQTKSAPWRAPHCTSACRLLVLQRFRFEHVFRPCSDKTSPSERGQQAPQAFRSQDRIRFAPPVSHSFKLLIWETGNRFLQSSASFSLLKCNLAPAAQRQRCRPRPPGETWTFLMTSDSSDWALTLS